MTNLQQTFVCFYLFITIYIALVLCDEDFFVDENYNTINTNIINKNHINSDIDTSYYSGGYGYYFDPPPPPTISTNINQINFLSSLYDATGGDNWKWSTSTTEVEWSFVGTPNPCGNAWQGIVMYVVSLLLICHHIIYTGVYIM